MLFFMTAICLYFCAVDMLRYKNRALDVFSMSSFILVRRPPPQPTAFSAGKPASAVCSLRSPTVGGGSN